MQILRHCVDAANQIPAHTGKLHADIETNATQRSQVADQLAVAARLFDQAEDLPAIEALTAALCLPGAVELELSEWLKLPRYLMVSGNDHTAWLVLGEYRLGRKDWDERLQIANNMTIVASHARQRECYLISLLWKNYLEGLIRDTQISKTLSSINLSDHQQYDLLCRLVDKNGDLTSAQHESSEEFEALRVAIWQQNNSRNVDKLYEHLQKLAQREGYFFPKELAHDLIDCRENLGILRYFDVLDIVHRHRPKGIVYVPDHGWC